MIVFHVTRPAAADAIDRGGFMDVTDTYMTDREWTGVWVSDRPLLEAAGCDDDAVIFVIDVADAAIADLEWVQEGQSYREWLVPADVLNRAWRRRIESTHAWDPAAVAAEIERLEATAAATQAPHRGGFEWNLIPKRSTRPCWRCSRSAA